MTAKVLPFHAHPSPIGHLIRICYSGHRHLETLYEQGRFAPDRIVVDAGRYDAQADLIETLWHTGTQVVLDPNVAELSVLGRFEGAGRNLDWANRARPLAPDDFRGPGGREIAAKIARFATARKVDVVLAPAHLIRGARDEWLDLDLRSSDLLRRALDDAGGHAIQIDYPLIVPYEVLRDPTHRRTLSSSLSGRHFQSLWVRTAGFGADATPVGVRRYIAALIDFHTLDRPIVADCVGGLAGLAAVAFGATSALAHGVAEKERFDAGKWNVRPQKGGGGQNGRIYLPGLDRHFKVSDAKSIIEARGGRRLLSCPDRECCPLGLDDMLREPKAHFLRQRRQQLIDLEKVPDLRRTARFLDYHLTSADRTARQAAKLNVNNANLQKTLLSASVRLDRMRGVLEELDHTLVTATSRSLSLELSPAVKSRREQRRGRG